MKQIAALILLAGMINAQPAAQKKIGRSTVSKSAQDYVAAFQRGEDFTPPSAGVFAGGQPDAAALQILGQELTTASPAVREKIVALLVDMGRRVDPLTPRGADVVRHPQILTILAGPGLAKPDLGRE